MPHVDDGQLHAWLDGESSVAEAERIDRHIAKCDECSGRLDEVARVHARAGELVADAQGASAPAWEELVARAADAAEPAARGRERGDDPDTTTTTPVRGIWTPRLLTSGLAWAATLVLAFGLGWYAGLRPQSEFRPDEASLPDAEVQPEAGRAGVDVRLAGEEQRGGELQKRAGQQLTAETSTLGETASDASAPPAPKASVPADVERNEVADNLAAAEQEEPTPVAEGRTLDQTEAVAAPREQLRDAAAMATPDIANWLGRAPLQLDGATLASANVAPLATGPGDPSIPAVWMLFDDPQTGARVTVAQRRWQQGDDADQPAVANDIDRAAEAKDADTAVLTVSPDGAPQLWWITADGYLVVIAADVDEDTLRSVARRIQ